MNGERRGLNRIMQVQFQEEGERLTARPQGRMEASDGIDFASAVEQRLHSGTRSVTIDLDELEFVNFGGIRAILRFARSLRGRQTALDFVRGNASVRDALDQAGLDDFYPFTPPYVSNKRGISR
jgi:anti-anti-sigma factor